MNESRTVGCTLILCGAVEKIHTFFGRDYNIHIWIVSMKSKVKIFVSHAREDKDHASSVSVVDRRLIYVYSGDVFSRDEQQQGIGIFSLVSKCKNAPPHILDGYSTDLVIEVGDPGQQPVIKKEPNKEYKISNEMLEDCEAIASAKAIFLNVPRLLPEKANVVDTNASRG